MKQSCIHYFKNLIPFFFLLFLSSSNISFAQALCPEDIMINSEEGQCCASVVFGSKSIISEEVVEGPLQINAGNQQVPMGVAFNPIDNFYYVARGNFNGIQLSTHDPDDGSVLHTESGNFDYRGIWWNPNLEVLQGNGYSNQGYRTIDLDASGYATGSGTDVPGQNQPFIQTQCAYDYEADEVLGRDGSLVYRYQLDGTLLGTISLSGSPVTSWTNYWVGYSGVEGSEIMVYDYIGRRILFFDKTTGVFSEEKSLPADSPSVSYYRISFSNDKFWIFDSTIEGYLGYTITEGTVGGGFSGDVTVEQTGGLASGSCFPIGETTNTFTVTDNETGSSSTCSFTVTVSDAEAPEVSCPEAASIPCGSSTTPDVTGSPAVTDNCTDMSNMTMSYSDSKVYIAGNEIITRTWTVSDEAGNTVSCDQQITIEGITDADSELSWIQTVDVANLYNDSGNNGGYVGFSMNTLFTIGESHMATLTPGYGDAETRAYWRIYIDYNQDGTFHHGSERAFQANGIGEITKVLNIAGTALPGNTKMRITMGTDGYVFPCDAGFEGEVEDYDLNLAECMPVTYAGEIGYDQAICPAENDPYSIGDQFAVLDESEEGILLEYIWMMNEINCEPTDGSETNGWTVINDSNSPNYDPGPLNNSTVFVRGVRAHGCQEYIFSNMVEVVYTEDCIPDCSAEGLSTANEYIYRVKFGNINNISGDDGGYADYTQMVAEVDPGQKVNYQFRPKFYNGAHDVHWRVWADWNQDGHFSNLCELVYEGVSSSTRNGSYTIPENAQIGETKLRVAMKDGSFPESCESFANGEVEDYSVMVGEYILNISNDQNGSLNELGSYNSDLDAEPDFNLSPNPTNGLVDIQLNNLSEDNILILHDHLGRQLLVQTVDVSNQNMTLNLRDYGLVNGVYFIKLRSNDKIITKKILLVD